MDFIEAKEQLKQGYIKAGLELSDEHGEELFFNFRSDPLKISKEDIESYVELSNTRNSFETKPSECSIISKNYREQIVTNIHPRARLMGPRFWEFMFGDDKISEDGSQEIYVKVSPCSDTFINYFRFEDKYLEMCFDGPLRHRGGVRRPESHVELKESLYRPLTIKVFNLNEDSINAALQKSNHLIDSCIFTLSSLKENPIELLEEWPLRRRRKRKEPRDFEYGTFHNGRNLPLPKFRANSTLVRFYQQATGTDIPALKYLAFYQILEYFYLSVSDEVLYNSLTRKINDLKFKTNPSHLDKIIQDVVNHKRENDETEMLKSVLKKFIDEEEIIDFIKEYEGFLEKKVYTASRTVFGVEITATSLKTSHTIGNVAKIIKAIRNALVHSSDRHERNDRYIPYSKEGTYLIELELPLIKFLAEKVIVASSSSL
ncbi:hypothetical protein [Hymenobacter convexus]|uniref:hypothetical protein n=1 Tax=Hymenobacter sp. CA1UV-4 TaxID=3063782 RepID=UPI002712CE97|nr:hypothetical protein [Hymenobacter sp. CA1UV-4]MDO7851903.1 hypothetical protein [Hymenobacter sp. CA1UV-4]